MTDKLRAALAAKATYIDPKTGQRHEADGQTVGDMVLASLIAGAVEGKIAHIKEVLDRTDGKVAMPIAVQKTEVKTFNLVLKRSNADGTEDQLSFGQSAPLGSLESPIDVTIETE